MASYDIVIGKHAAKFLERLRDRDLISRLFGKIETLESSPMPPDTRKIRGTDSDYRLRVGDYRIIYRVVSEERKIFIMDIGHRKEIYR